jgi:hypothetical protein
VQTYSNGQVVHWIDPSLTAEHPAPRINITAKGGVVEDIAGDEAGPAAGQTAPGQTVGGQTALGQTAGGQAAAKTAPVTAAPASGRASKGLAIAALIVGALGLIAGLAALVSSRRTARS